MCAACGVAEHLDVRTTNRPEAAAAPPPARQGLAFSALRHKDFRAYVGTGMVAMMGDNIEHVISYWVLYQVFESPLLGGYAVISHWMPFLLMSVYFGGLADRYDCRRIIQAGQVLFLFVSLAWGVLILTDTLQTWHAVVLLTLHGIAGALWMPANQLMLHDIVGRSQLQSAVRLNSTGRNVSVLLGPGIGAVLMLALGPGVGILVNALFYLPVIIWLARVPYTGHLRDDAAHTRRVSGLGFGATLAVLRSVSHNRTIIAMLVISGASSLLVGNAYQAQMPAFALSLGVDDFGYSLLLGATAAGAVIGGLALETTGLLKANPRNAILCATAWTLAVAGFAVTSSFPVALVLLFLVGLFNLAAVAMAQTLVQLEAPPEQRGKVIGLYGMSQFGLRTGSGFTVGVLGGLIGVHWSLGLSAVAMLAVALGMLAFSVAGARRAAAAAATVVGSETPAGPEAVPVSAPVRG